jgi:hypothetical protein
MQQAGAGQLAAEFESLSTLIDSCHRWNAWFTPDNVKNAIGNLGKAITSPELNRWLSTYEIGEFEPKRIGMIMAGNIPAVGFHDLICTILTGHKAVIKLSRDDDKLIPELLNILAAIEPAFKKSVEIKPEKLGEVDAVIATGSDNSARYFEYYFGHLPHVIRKNRNSVAVITGNETAQDLQNLGHDIFDFFGHGCRSVSKLYVPEGYDFDFFFKSIYDFNDIINHHKYANNYDYNKAVWLMNLESLLDNGFLLLKEEASLTSPTGSLYYEYYSNKDNLNSKLKDITGQLQCAVGEHYVAFGKSQSPALDEYADGFDTISWLLSLT